MDNTRPEYSRRFFERRCATLVTGAKGWRVLAANYPVEFPPPNGPFRGKESCLDIWARRDADSPFVDTLIECKKANPDFVNWVFFSKVDCPAPSPFSHVRVDNNPKEETTSAWSSQMSIARGTIAIPIVNDAREVRGEYAKYNGTNKTKTSNAAIQEAAYQVGDKSDHP